MYQGGGERMMMRQKEKQTMGEGTERARGERRLRFRKMNRLLRVGECKEDVRGDEGGWQRGFLSPSAQSLTWLQKPGGRAVGVLMNRSVNTAHAARSGGVLRVVVCATCT